MAEHLPLPPLPKASPQPPRLDGSKTDPALKLERIYAAHKELERTKLNRAVKEWAKLFTLCAAMGGGVFGFFRSCRAEAKIDEHKTASSQAIEDEKHQRERDVDDLARSLKEHAEEHRKLDHWRGKTDQRLDLLLDAAKVPKSKRPTEDE